MRPRASWTWSVLLAGVTLLAREAQGCSVCLGWTDGQGLNGGFYWSALFLTLLPFAVVAVIGAWVCRALRTRQTTKPVTNEKR